MPEAWAEPTTVGSIYTAQQYRRRSETVWTTVQAILAPLQFLAFGVSLVLVLRFLATGNGYEIATASILLKTALLYGIMVSGAIWEKIVFGQYLFAGPFFWADVFSFVAIGLHTAYVWALLAGSLSPNDQMLLALAAYAAYVVNAGQFLWLFRGARPPVKA